MPDGGRGKRALLLDLLSVAITVYMVWPSDSSAVRRCALRTAIVATNRGAVTLRHTCDRLIDVYAREVERA